MIKLLMIYYALSDIHGKLGALKETLENVDLENPENKLILLGDYIDMGEQSCEVLYYVKELCEKYPGQVIALLGNHEEMFLEWLLSPIEAVHWLNEDRDLVTVKTFISDVQLKEISAALSANTDIFSLSELIVNMIKENHKELREWLRKLPLYYETEDQIFVHAGIDEEAEDFWKHGTPEEFFTEKFPPTKASFYKDIIAGHVGVSSEYLANDENFNEIYWDKKNHYYIDGSVCKTGNLLLLKYDTETKTYTI